MPLTHAVLIARPRPQTVFVPSLEFQYRMLHGSWAMPHPLNDRLPFRLCQSTLRITEVFPLFHSIVILAQYNESQSVLAVDITVLFWRKDKQPRNTPNPRIKTRVILTATLAISG